MAAVRYVGFETKEAVREYAFVAHRVRYQDDSEICSLRLQREIRRPPASPSRMLNWPKHE
jgi:hypothetical protein